MDFLASTLSAAHHPDHTSHSSPAANELMSTFGMESLNKPAIDDSRNVDLSVEDGQNNKGMYLIDSP